MKIAIASGKGGTGKTTVAVNLAAVLDGALTLLDCDVEEPNVHLFIKGVAAGEIPVTLPLPQINESLCTGCGACSEFCAYCAIVTLGRTCLVFPEMCHGCGGCMRLCPVQAISEVPRRIGVINVVKTDKVTIISGKLDIGTSQVPPLIRAVKRYAERRNPILIDAPPGTSCPLISAVQGADLVLLVTEPTPFGEHDLKMAVATMRELGMPICVIINRANKGDRRIHDFCERERIPILCEITEDRRIAEAYSQGRLITEEMPEYRDLFERLARKIKKFSEECSCAYL